MTARRKRKLKFIIPQTAMNYGQILNTL